MNISNIDSSAASNNRGTDHAYLSKTHNESSGSKRVSFSSTVLVSKDFKNVHHRKNSSAEHLQKAQSLPNLESVPQNYLTAPRRESQWTEDTVIQEGNNNAADDKIATEQKVEDEEINDRESNEYCSVDQVDVQLFETKKISFEG